MNRLTKKMVAFIREEEGLTTVEYAIAGGLVALVLVGAFTDLGKMVGGVITGITGKLGATGATPLP